MKKANYKWMVYNTGFSIAHDFDGPTLYVCNCINIYPFKNTYTNSIKLSLDAFETIPPPLFEGDYTDPPNHCCKPKHSR